MALELPPFFDGANFPVFLMNHNKAIPVLVKRRCRYIFDNGLTFAQLGHPSPLLAWESGLSDPISKPLGTGQDPPTHPLGPETTFSTENLHFPTTEKSV